MNILNRKTNKKAYSKFLKAWIRCVRYINDNEWYFCFLDDWDNRNVMRANSNYKLLDWYNI